MKKGIALAALAVIAMAPAFAKAEDAMMKKDSMTKTEMSSTTTASAAKEMTMKDGTKVMVDGDKVYTMSADGTKTAAKDGTWEMADGTKVMTKDGMMVKDGMMKK